MLKSYEKYTDLRKKIVKESCIKICGDDYIGVGIYGADKKFSYVIYGYEPSEIVVYIEDEKEDTDEVLILTINSIAFKNYMTKDAGIFGEIARDINNLLG